MSKSFLWIVLAILFLVQGYDVMAQEARARYELLNLIRKDKFDKILPVAMRNHNVEDNALVTELGIEALYPRNEKMILVR